MAERLSLWRTTINRLRQTLRVATAKEVHVGTDEHGNRYYERLDGKL